MKEKLIIKNFGPIKDVELELGKFNVLIGEQATGKSTVAKLLGFCRYFSNIEGGYYEKETQENKNHGIDELGERLLKWGLFEHVNNDCFVSYECKHYKFSFDKRLFNFGKYDPLTKTYTNGSEYHLTSNIKPITKEFKELLDEFYRLDETGKLTYEFYEDYVSEIMDNPFFFPTERGLQSIFSLGKDSTSNMSDPLFRYFVDVEKIIRSFKSETEISALNIQFKSVDGKNQVKKNNESSYFDLINAASGYQSAIPIVLVIKYYDEIRNKAKTFIIEEPELNLFPSAQAELMKFFAEQIKFHNEILLTTHSPYILTSLNNLMYAYQVGQNNKEEINKEIKENFWVNPDDVSAYQLLPDGTCENIFERDEALIQAEKIDEISRKINEDFDKMIDIEIAAKHETIQ